MIGNKLNWISLGGKVTDYNQLSNKPIKRIKGTLENPIRLWRLMGGLYLLNGIIEHANGYIVEYYEKESLFVSVTTEKQNEKCIVSVFVPFWEAQYDYVMDSFYNEDYAEHQVVKMLMEGSRISELTNDCEYITKKELNSMFSFDKDGNLNVTINGVTKKFIPEK